MSSTLKHNWSSGTKSCKEENVNCQTTKYLDNIRLGNGNIPMQMIERGNICPASAAFEPLPPLLTGTWLRNVPFTDLTTLLDLRLRNSNSFETSLFTFVNIFCQGKLNECDIVCKYLSHRAQIDDNFSARSTFFLSFVFLYIVIFSSSSHHHHYHHGQLDAVLTGDQSQVNESSVQDSPAPY